MKLNGSNDQQAQDVMQCILGHMVSPAQYEVVVEAMPIL